jgi:hypothetical protein
LASGATAGKKLDPESAREFVRLLEGRRLAYEQAQWQAPTLTIAAQAFLLTVLSNSEVSGTARVFILIAGALASFAAAMALIRLRARELLYSGAVSYHACGHAELPDPRPPYLEDTQQPVPAGTSPRADRQASPSRREIEAPLGRLCPLDRGASSVRCRRHRHADLYVVSGPLVAQTPRNELTEPSGGNPIGLPETA